MSKAFSGLCVGGPAAGKYDTARLPRLVLVRETPVGTEKFTYKAQKIHTSDSVMHFWCPHDWSVRDMLTELATTYANAHAQFLVDRIALDGAGS